MTKLERSKIVHAARSWVGTPYSHQTSTKHRGTDCLGLVRGVWREVVGEEPEEVPFYTADWSEALGEERLWGAAQRHFKCVKPAINAVGDVVLFRMRRRSVAKHLAILANNKHNFKTIIHAYSGAGVVETPLTDAWAKRIVAQFEFPVRRG